MTAMEQLDLFDFIEGETRGAGGQDQLRFATVLTCMRDAMPNAMEFFVNLTAKPDRQWHGSGEWSYWWSAVKIVAYPRRRGEEEQAITWEELAELVRDHPDRQAVLDWEQSLDVPKWWNLGRPIELSPYGGDDSQTGIQADHDQPGWEERLKAWKTLQSILTDVINETAPDAASFKLPKQEWQRPRGACRFCHAEVIVGSYAEGLNHSPMGNVCTSQWLIRNHAFASRERMEAGKRDPKAKCREHQDSHKPCPQEHFEADYERDAARATEAWHGDGWKTTS